MTEYKDSVKDRFTTTGTGTITVDGVAAAGCRTIASAHSTGATVSYRMENASQTEWEDGEGVWTASGSTLTRVSVLASSNSNALVNFSAGTKIVSTTLSAKSVLGSISARNTVQSGPINTDGSSNFGGSTGSTTVTASGTLIFTAAGGFGRGAIDWVSSITNPSWTGLSTNGTMYLFLDADTVGGATTASSTLPMIETRGATPATTSGQLTYNYVEHKSYLGNGSTAPQARRVPVGEVTVSGGVVAAGSIIWYALNRDYDSGLIATLPAASTAVSVNHYLGSKRINIPYIECIVADNGYAVGDRITNWQASSSWTTQAHWDNRLSAGYSTPAAGSTHYAQNKSTGGNPVALTSTSWKYGFIVKGAY